MFARLSFRDVTVLGNLQALNFYYFLTILARYEAKIAKIYNFWTFRHVIQVIKQLFKIRQNFGKIVY